MSRKALLFGMAGLVAAAGLTTMVLMRGEQPARPVPSIRPPEPPRPGQPGATSYLFTEKDPPTQADPAMTRRLIDTVKASDPAGTVAILLDVRKDATTRNEAANLLRRSGYRILTDDLIRSLGGPEEGPLWRSYCIQHLWMNTEGAADDEKCKIIGMLRSSLADRHTRVRREALLALCRLKEPLGQETAVRWLTTREGEGARDVAIRCLEDLGLREQAPAVRKLTSDPDESTVVQAIGTLGRWGDEASRPAIEEAAKSKSARLQNAAQMALKRMDAAKRLPNPDRPPSEPLPVIR